MTATAPVAVVIGAGDATGGAIARRFAREGFTLCVTRRNADSATDPMSTTYLVDSGASRDGSPLGFFPTRDVSTGDIRRTSVRSSNGIAQTIVQRLNMPRLLPGGTPSQERRDVLQINGPLS